MPALVAGIQFLSPAADDVHPDHHLGEALHKGAPLNFKIRAPGAVPFYFSAGVLKNARHPNAAKLPAANGRRKHRMLTSSRCMIG